MSKKKLFSLFVVIAGLLSGLTAAGASASKQGEFPAGSPDSQTRDWNRPASAKDVRTLIYRASRAGKRQESMTLGSAEMNGAGITLKGASCKKGAVWLNFSENASTHMVGGKLCKGGKSFKRRPNYGPQRFSSLLAHVSSRVLAGIKVDILRVGTPLLIRSDGKRALVLFDRDNAKEKNPIRAIRFDGTKRMVERY